MAGEIMQEARRMLKMVLIVHSFRGAWFGITELSERAHLPKGSTHRYARVLVEEGWLDYEPATSKYRAMTSKG